MWYSVALRGFVWWGVAGCLDRRRHAEPHAEVLVDDDGEEALVDVHVGGWLRGKLADVRVELGERALR